MFIDAGTGDFSDHDMAHGTEALGNEAAPHEIGTMFDNGDFVIKSPNDVHGHDTFVNGQHVTHTEENVFGGSNIYHGHHLDEITMPNVHGGMDVYDGNHDVIEINTYLTNNMAFSRRNLVKHVLKL